MPHTPGAHSIQFKDCVFEMHARRLFRAGNALALEPKMFELLEVLITRSPAVVTNEELDEILWPKVYVARTSLTRLVSELRSLLGDDARDSRIIRTVYKRGYAFCADITGAPPEARRASGINLMWQGRSLALVDGEQVLGRGTECDLVIDVDSVSRRHARIIVRDGAASIEDLGSKNGTHVEGSEIRGWTKLHDGAKVALGVAQMIVRMQRLATVTVARPSDHAQRR